MDHFNFIDADPRPHATDDEVERKYKFEVWVNRHCARQEALKAAAAGPAPYVVLISFLVLFGLGQLSDVIAMLIVWFSTIALAGAYIVIIGYGSAEVAHRFAYGTTVSVVRLARGLVWIANLSLWGWGVVGLFATE